MDMGFAKMQDAQEAANFSACRETAIAAGHSAAAAENCEDGKLDCKNCPFGGDRYREIRQRGYYRGRNIASAQEMPADEERSDAEDKLLNWAYDAEENNRQFTPFEFTAHEFNSRDDSEACWEAYQSGIDQGISDEVKARLDRKFGGTPA